MSSHPESGDERDSSFGLPDSYFEDLKPGFRPAEKRRKAEPGHDRFPHISEEKDVPHEPLAERIARQGD